MSHALEEAVKTRLDFLKESNRHAESMRGIVGRLFGHDNNTPVYVAATGMIIGLIGCIGLFWVASQKPPDQSAPWMQQAERFIAFSATCLAFIFGKGLNKE